MIETKEQLFINWNVCAGATLPEPDADIPVFKTSQWDPEFYLGIIERILDELSKPDQQVTMTVQEVPVGDYDPGTLVPHEPDSLAARIEGAFGFRSISVVNHPNHVQDGNGMLATSVFYRPGRPLRARAAEQLPYPQFNLQLPEQDIRGARTADRFDKYVLVAEPDGEDKEAADAAIVTWQGQPEGYLRFSRNDSAHGSDFASQEEDLVIDLARPLRTRPLIFAGDFNTLDVKGAFPRLFEEFGLTDPLENDGETRARGTRTAYMLVNQLVEVPAHGIYKVPAADHHVLWIKARTHIDR